MKKLTIQNNVIFLNVLLHCFNTVVDFLVVAEQRYCGDIEKGLVALNFYLNTKGSKDYVFGRSAKADIPFTEEAVTKYAKSYISGRGQELYAETVRLASIRKPSVKHRFYYDKYCDYDEMTVSIPYRTIGTQLCKSLELWLPESMKVRLDKKDENLEIIQTLRISNEDDYDDYFYLDVDAELIPDDDDSKDKYKAINEVIKNIDPELPF